MATTVNSARPHTIGAARVLCRSAAAPRGERVALGDFYTAIGAVSARVVRIACSAKSPGSTRSSHSGS